MTMKGFYQPLIILLFIFSCSNNTDPEITNLLQNRENAYEQKDLELYSSLLSNNYENKTKSGIETKDAALKNFKINTTPFDRIAMNHKDRTIYKEGEKAKVVQKTTVELEIENKVSTYKLTEIIVLAKIENRWEIVKESKIDLFKGSVFGESG